MIKNWNPDKLKQAVVKRLMENADSVGEFVKSEAQKNLLAIEEPRWGRRYRASLAYRHLAYEVE